MRERVGLDVGGSAVKAGRIDENGKVLEELALPIDPDLEPDERLDALAGLALELGASERLGVGLPGLLDRRRGRVVRSPNLPWLVDLPVRDGLATRLGLAAPDVLLENDANLAALAEQWRGAAAGARDVLVLTLGTGIGGGLILDGDLRLGGGSELDFRLAGEVGHMKVDPDGPVCGCGGRGCLETLASATAVRRRALARSLPEESPGDLELLAAKARAGGAPESELLTEVGRDLGHGLAQVLMLLDLRTFVFAGGFAAALDTLEAGIRTGLSEWAWGAGVGGVRLLRAGLGPRAGWIGAARLALL